jgi:hypothetical protein
MAKAPKVSAKGGTTHHHKPPAAAKGAHHPPAAGSPAPKKPPATPKHPKAAKHPRAAKHPKAAKAKRGYSLGDVSCCVIQAIAGSLKGEGFPVTEKEILALHLRIAGPDEYVTIEDGLRATEQYGLAGMRPSYDELTEWVPGQCVILGVTDPAPHAVCDVGGGWYSWGQHWEPWAEPDEAWLVSWYR